MDTTKLLEDDELPIAQRCDRATPGPWTLTKPAKAEDGWATGVTIAATYGRQAIYATPEGGQFPANDAEFIAASRSDVPLLLSRLRECRKQVEQGQREFAAEQLESIASSFIQAYRTTQDLAELSASDVAESLRESAAELRAKE